MSAKASSKKINWISIVIGCILLTVRILTVSIHKSPYEMIHKLDHSGIIPPVWILNLSFGLLFFALGYAAGLIIGKATTGKGKSEVISAYRGGLYFMVALFTLTVHYPLFFSMERLAISLLTVLVATVSLALCAISWARISKGAMTIITLCAIFSSYASLINLLILISN